MILSSNEDVSKSFRTGRLELELQMVQLSATRYSCITILCASLVSFAATILCVASQRVFRVVYFVIDFVLQLFDMPSYKICDSQIWNSSSGKALDYSPIVSGYTVGHETHFSVREIIFYLTLASDMFRPLPSYNIYYILIAVDTAPCIVILNRLLNFFAL
jgi:hypothetical protein